ncbi:MAG: phage integrase SAM-like domain-containing protein [Leptothrix sp. (in: b-proteobacteria)]
MYYLHIRIAGKQIKRSLSTGNKWEAVARAVAVLSALGKMEPMKVPDNIKKYEIDLGRGVFKADGQEDHDRMMKALEKLDKTGLVLPKEPAKAKVKGVKLNELVARLLKLKAHLKEATRQSYTKTMRELGEFLKDPWIEDVGVKDISNYQEFLAEKKNSIRTIDNKIAITRAMFNFAIEQGDYTSKNPAENRALQSKRQKMQGGYEILEKDEIKLIYQSEWLKKDRIENPDYFWVMQLGLLTGCRVSELATLKASQFRETEQGQPYIKILDAKTLAGKRDIPIPAELMKAGLGEYISGKEKVFSYMERPGKGAGNAVGKRFSRHWAELRLTREKLVFHSIRKFVNDYFMNEGIGFEMRRQFIGHEIDSVNIQTYTKKFAVDDMGRHMRSAQLKLMALSKLIPSDF